LDASCAFTGCHSSSSKASGVVLDNYDDERKNTENGKVICTINYASGCAPMPPSGKLADSLIQKIECWAKKGFVN
ncbi:MAG: hypothetical protein NZ522_03635, partial [Chitinophagales bacterium]|nr:hypothetical protein [Chitinophagales bacterium]